jgi:chemotaxis response regulator CheB
MYGVAAGAAALVIGAGIVMSGAGSAGTAGPEAMATTGPPEIGQATNDGVVDP